MSNETPGPTGDFPAGSLGPHDRGGLRAALSIDRQSRRLTIDFGTRLSWLSMTPGEALALADALRDRARQLLDHDTPPGGSTP